MEHMEYDLIVVGGGFSGLSLLQDIKSLNVLLLEEHKTIGKPQHCAGLISGRALHFLSSYRVNPKEILINSFRSFTLYSPSLKPLTLDFKHTIAHVINRVKLEKILYENVMDNVNSKFGVKVSKVGFGWVYSERIGIARAKAIVVSEGFKHLISKRLRVNHYRRYNDEFVIGIQRDYRVHGHINSSDVAVIFNNTISPGYYSWAIPLTDNIVRLGVAGKPTVKNQNLKLLEKIYEKIFSVKVEPKGKIFGGKILTIGPPSKDHINNIIFLGDTAFHVKPVSGGGIYTAALFSKALSKSIQRRLSEDLHVALREYYRETLEVRRRLKIQSVMAKILHKSSDNVKERIWSIIGDYGLEGELVKNVDYDYHDEIFKLAIRKPKLIMYGFYVVSSLILELVDLTFKLRG